MKIFFLSL